LSGLFNVPADQDQDEESDPNQAELRAIDGFNPNEPLLDYALENGVTTFQTAPGHRNVIAGQAAIFKTRARTRTVDGMVIRPISAMLFTLGEAPKELYGTKGKAPTTRMGSAALIRRALVAAQNYEHKKNAEPDLKMQALLRVLHGEIPAVFTVHREDDILTALRIGKEFGLKVILDGATEGYLVAGEIAKANVPVIVSPTMIRASSFETRNATLENAALLADAHVKIAIQSGFEGYVPKTRLALFEASVAAANGLGLERALAAVTVDAARILGVADRVGSLEEGKDADLVLFNGDPFEYVTRVEAVVSGGQVFHPKY
jgi:imidazolonepropionase-like amidohydrolase